MGDPLFSVIKPCSHNAVFLSHAAAQHFFQTVRRNEFRVHIQEKKVLATCTLNRTITAGCRIFSFLTMNQMKRFFCQPRFQCLFLCQDQVFIILIRGFPVDGCNAAPQSFFFSTVKDQDREQRTFLPYKASPEQSRMCTFLYQGFLSQTLIMRLQSQSSLLPVFLCFGQSPFRYPYMTKDPRNMHDFLRFRRFCQPKKEIIITGSGKIRIHFSLFFKKGTVHHKKTAYIIGAFQKLRIKIRFQFRLKKMVAVR